MAKAWMHMRKLDRNSLYKAGALAPLDFLEEIYWLKKQESRNSVSLDWLFELDGITLEIDHSDRYAITLFNTQ
jgi:hypothetical protein